MMNSNPKFLWISASPSLKSFHRRLLNNLAKVVEIEFWEYYQTPDETSSIDGSINLLREYLQDSNRSVHLIGHGIGGIIALGYARLYPAKIASLTLLSVAAQPAITWHSYYYSQLKTLPSSRYCVLRSIATNLLPYSCSNYINDLVPRLERDLLESPSNHSLLKLAPLSQGGVEMPIMICGGKGDPIITESALFGWRSYFKSEDIIWRSPEGGHFFHHFNSDLLAYHIHKFWHQIEPQLLPNRIAHLELK
jgi:pimeloyl-ACP methyl ester carboxylesterase